MAFINWIIFAMVAPTFLSAAKIQLLDITPEEAQKLITQQSLDLRYAKKLSEGSANGRSYNGKIIDSDDYAEEVYDANQFHGQDGLGRAIFGYTDNRQSRLEARNVNGEVRGQYQYLDPFGNDIRVQYWVDSLGFHQTDNRPQYDLKPVTETPEVRQAREEHERLWKEAARLNGVDVDSTGVSYSSAAENLENDDYNDDERELEGQVSNQHQSLTRYPILPYEEHIKPNNAKSFGKVTDDSVVVDTRNVNSNQRSRFARQQSENIDEVTSEPRGFFYSFDYPVPFIVDRNARLRQSPEAQASEQIDIRFETDTNVNETPSEVQQQRFSESIRDEISPQDEVHDVQASPKQNAYNNAKNKLQSNEKYVNLGARVSEDIRDEVLPQDEVHDVQATPKQNEAKKKLRLTEKNVRLGASPKSTVNRGRGSVKFNNR